MQLQFITLMALAMNNVEFVRLILEYGVSINSFLTNEVLEFLYGFRSYDKGSPLRYELQDSDYKPASANCDNDSVYKALVAYEDQISMNRILIPRDRIESLIADICSTFFKFGTEKFIEVSLEVCCFRFRVSSRYY